MNEADRTDLGGRIVQVEGLLGQLLGRPTPHQPVGEDHEWMRVSALQVDGIDIGWTPFRPADSSGAQPIWNEFVNNVGDIDTPPIQIPLGPRHRSIGG
jgi:hypothetical protein